MVLSFEFWSRCVPILRPGVIAGGGSVEIRTAAAAGAGTAAAGDPLTTPRGRVASDVDGRMGALMGNRPLGWALRLHLPSPCFEYCPLRDASPPFSFYYTRSANSCFSSTAAFPNPVSRRGVMLGEM